MDGDRHGRNRLRAEPESPARGAAESDRIPPGPRLWPPAPQTHYERAIEHLVASLDAGEEPIISGRRVLRGTELTFASWESARRCGRAHLPLEIDDNPLEAMYEAGQLGGLAE
ncbi:hypothetical protein [Halorubrum sp. Ea8]|uniref:hypothetical protein n=1 Tax=Halorubrum sp. Ea8 TaxID=1383841 RepID=UPI0026C1C180|nr:hypothetical protein [Halorubrum sp. Ea8]